MAKVGKLNVEIGADTKSFRRGMKESRSDIGKWAKTVRGMRNMAGGLGSGITRMGQGAAAGLATVGVAAGAAAVGLGYVAKEQIDLIGDQADAAKKLGITRNALVTLQRAAKGTGVDADKLTSGMEKMGDVLGSAFRGDSGAVKTIEGLGLKTSELYRMNPEARFLAIGQAIDRIDDPAMRIAAARDVFGKAGGDLIPLFDGAGTAVKNAASELKLFGGLLSNIDQHGIEQAGDAFDGFGTILDGFKNQLAAEVAPVIVKLGTDTRTWIEELGGVEAIADKGLVALEGKLLSVAKATDTAIAAARTAGDIKSGVGNMIDKVTPGGAVGGAIKSALTWNPVRDTVGALWDKNQSDLALERMEDKASRRMTGKATTKTGAIAQYIDDARSENAISAAAAEPGAVAQAPAPVAARDSAWTRASGKPTLEASERSNWESKIPNGEPNWKSKIPVEDGPANWKSKRPEPRNFVERDPMQAALNANPTGKNTGNGSSDADMQENNQLLREVRDALRGGVPARYS